MIFENLIFFSTTNSSWGFKCIVTEFIPKKNAHWSLDIETSIVRLCANYIKVKLIFLSLASDLLTCSDYSVTKCKPKKIVVLRLS